MARKSKSLARRPKKLQPAELTMTFATAVVDPAATLRSVIDLSQCASILNRRFYRQGLNWAVAGFKIQSQQPFTLNCQKLPNTWSTSNAWHKSFALWHQQQQDALEDGGSESALARFNDFKVHADVAHVTAGVGANLLPVDGLGTPAVPGEWDMSQIVIPQVNPDGSGTLIEPAEFLLHMVGVNRNAAVSRGIIEGYADSRAFPHSPDPVSPDIASADNWMRTMFNVGSDTEEITDNATNHNDELPYPQVNYPGGETQLPGLQFHDISQIYATSATTNIGVARVKGGNFPCGLVIVEGTNKGDTPANIVIQVDLIPGHHRGYLAEPMQEM